MELASFGYPHDDATRTCHHQRRDAEESQTDRTHLRFFQRGANQSGPTDVLHQHVGARGQPREPALSASVRCTAAPTGNPKLLERTDAIGFLEDDYPKFKLEHFKDLRDPSNSIKLIFDAISRARDEVVDAARYRT